MTPGQKAAIEVAATKAWEADARHNPYPNNPYAYRNGFKAGAKEVIEHPERYDLATAAHTAALRERVRELENELKLSEDTIKHQAERCLKLESALAESEKVNFDLAAHQCDKWEPEENGHWSCRLQAQNERYRKALEDVIIRLEEDKRFNALYKAKEALKQEGQ